MKNVLIITGNKGGVGKSMVSVLLADYMIRNGRANELLCGDAEASDLQRTFAAMMRGSGHVGEDAIRTFDFSSDEGMETFIDDMSDLDDRTAIIDTGANLQAYLTSQAGFLKECREDMKAEVTVIFVASPAEESATALQDFMMKAGEGFRVRVILTGPEDIEAGDYALFRNPDYKGTLGWMEVMGVKFHFLGKIPERFFELMMRGDRKVPARILESLEGRSMKRRFAGWLSEKVDPVMAEILGAGDA